ncbi:MAG: isochorismate synthase [Acidimicrobiia bacterium]|nr:isochorismate synthase [Acidimicrobiia bacterium]
MLIDPGLLASLGTQISGLSDSEMRVGVVPVDLDPLSFVRSGAHLFPFAGYFGVPDTDEVGALGVAWQTSAPYGADRFSDLARRLGALDLPAPVRVMVGFSFRPEGASHPEWDGFTPTHAVVPLLSIVRAGDTSHLVVVLPPGRSWEDLAMVLAGLVSPDVPGTGRTTDLTIESRPSPSDWEHAVGETVATIRSGVVSKVVMARSVVVSSDMAYRPFDLVDRLRADYPACYVFGWQQGDATFLGASPELLLEKHGAMVRSHPLAGSAPRGQGEDEDRSLGELLMSSSKDRSEHRMVVDDVAERLASLTDTLHVDAVPSLRKTRNVQHLSTELQGHLNDGQHLVEVAGELHPTPAVGGSPRAEALSFMDKEEIIDRGWYAGGIGWSDGSGDGVIAVALRCALVRGQRAWLYAGAGIVADSNPAAELEETRLKFRTMMNLLAES